MNTLLIYLFVVIGLQAPWYTRSEDISLEKYRQTMEKFIDRERLLQKSDVLCPGYREIFKDAFTKSGQCWALLAEKSSKTLCSVVKNHTSRCFEPLKKVLTLCLPDRSRDIPQFVIDALVDVVDYMYEPSGKQFVDACGGLFVKSRNGTITSPLFPNFYPFNKYCVWEIETEPQYRVMINFTHFDLEGIENSRKQQCEYDRVEVYSKMNDGKFKKHGSYCGPKAPGLITSEGNVMRIVFSSDSSVQRTGFAAVFFTDMDECTINNGGCQHICHNTLDSYTCYCRDGFTLQKNGKDCKIAKESCNHEISVPFGTISSPSYPDNYPPRLDCAWYFNTTPGHRIRIVFQKFELELDDGCSYDYLNVYDGSSRNGPSLGRYCGPNLPPLILAVSNQLYMTFKSDASIQRTGFWATHYTVCGGVLESTLEKQFLYSHAKFGSANYENRADCDWIIKANERRNIRISFLTFDIEEGDMSCSNDYVEIFNGIDSKAPSIGKYCGSKAPFAVTSTQNFLLIRFHSDDTVVNKGFSLTYEAV